MRRVSFNLTLAAMIGFSGSIVVAQQLVNNTTAATITGQIQAKDGDTAVAHSTIIHRKHRHRSHRNTKRVTKMNQPNSTPKKEADSSPTAKTPTREIHDPADYPAGKKPPKSTYKPRKEDPTQ